MEGPVFTCNSCMIQFPSSDLQRYHMKTEWHRYNLKRRVAKLAPISASLFAEKLQVSQREKELNQVDEFGFPILKTASSSHTKGKKKGARVGRGRSLYQITEKEAELIRTTSPALSVVSHLSRSTFASSNLDEETVTEFGFTTEDSLSQYSDSEDSYSDEDNNESDRILPTQCIYCGKQYKELESNVRHMFKSHGLFIPERSYLIDIEGLLNHLIDELIVKKNCLSCSFKGSSVESIRAHMSSKGHCMLPYESKDERSKLASFYDFSSLDEEVIQTGHSSANRVRFNEQNTTSEVYPGIADEETQEENLDAAINSNFALVHVDQSGIELTLPTGAKVGHRSMKRYYKQNIPLGPEITEDKKTLIAADKRVQSFLPSRESQKATAQLRQMESFQKNKNIRLKLKRTNNQAHYRDELLQ